MEIYIATGNAHKVEEFKAMLVGVQAGLEVHSAQAVGGMPEVDENADSFEGNALLKAQALLAQVPAEAYVLADDSGLVVDALEGAPGVYSARYAGADATDADNNEKLLKALETVPEGKRTARFVCCLQLLKGDTVQTFAGTCEGKITLAEQGAGGFGYDPLFIPEGYEQSLGMLGAAVKNELSHRGQAVKILKNYLASCK